jgi:hypothetical protein
MVCMESAVNLQQIVTEIEKLDYEGKISLMTKILSLLKREDQKNQAIPITQLQGLGKSIWLNIDIESYLKTERESWE